MRSFGRVGFSAIALMLFVAFLTVRTFAQEEAEDNAGGNAHIYLPLVVGGDAAGNDVRNGVSTALDWQQWPTHHSSELHITFAYPGDWQLALPLDHGETEVSEVPEREFIPPPGGENHVEGYVIQLSPPEGAADDLSKIEITVESYEIDEGQSLAEWQQERAQLSNLAAPEMGVQVGLTELTSAELRQAMEPEQVLHGARVLAGPGLQNQAVWITKGWLVYVIVTYVDTPAMTEVLGQIATSLQFDPDAPEDLNTFHNTTFPRPSIQETLEQFQIEEEPACDIVCRDAEAAEPLTGQPDCLPGAS